MHGADDKKNNKSSSSVAQKTKPAMFLL